MTIQLASPFAYRLKGRWLLFARLVWVALALLAVFILIGGMWETYRRYSEPLLCTLGTPIEQNTCLANTQALVQLGLPIGFYGPQTALIMLVEAVPMLLVGALIFSQKSDELFGLLFSLVIIFTGTIAFDPSIPYFYLQLWMHYPILVFLGQLGMFLGGSLVALWCVFPDGHFVPRWTRWLLVVFAVTAFPRAFLPNSPFSLYFWLGPFHILVDYLLAASLPYSLIYRYRYTADATQRQQIKWVVGTAAL